METVLSSRVEGWNNGTEAFLTGWTCVNTPRQIDSTVHPSQSWGVACLAREFEHSLVDEDGHDSELCSYNLLFQVFCIRNSGDDQQSDSVMPSLGSAVLQVLV